MAADSLPPGLLGYRAAVEDAQRRDASNIQNLAGLLSIQGQLEMRPLQRMQLEMAIADSVRKQKALAAFGNPQDGESPSPMAFGEGGISLPGGGAQANMNTGQAVATPRPMQSGGVNYTPAQLKPLADAGVNVKPYLDIYTASQPQIEWVNGVPMDKRTAQPFAGGMSVPQINREGFGTQTLPDPTAPGGFRVAIPAGSEQAFSRQRDIQNRSESQYKLREVPVAGGGTRLMSELQFLQGNPQSQPIAVPSASSMQIPPAVQAQRDADAARIQKAELLPNGGGMIPSSTVLGVGQTPQQKSEQQEYGQALGKQTATVMEDAAKAAISNRYLDTMEGFTKDFTPGKLAPMQNTLTQWAQAFGLPITEQDKKAAGSIQALTSMAIKMAGQATRQADAQPSQLQYFKILESMPNEQRTPEGFARIIGYMRDLNNVNIIKAQKLQQWRQQNGTSDGFESAWPNMAKDLPFAWNTDKSISDAKNTGNPNKISPSGQIKFLGFE